MIIRHRAKTTTGEWVEGLVHVTNKSDYDAKTVTRKWYVSGIEIDPTTIEPILPECEWEDSSNGDYDGYNTSCGHWYARAYKRICKHCPNCGGKIKEKT